VKDLATKKQVTIKITPAAQMRRLPDRMAQALAARLNGSAGGGQGGGQGGGAQNPFGATGQRGGTGQYSGGGGGAPPAPTRLGAGSEGSGQYPGGAQGGGGDMQQMLSRAPAIQLADLKKGDAVMLVSTEGTTDVTAVTLLAGVEPLLQAPAASNLLSNWSMSSGGAEAAGAQ